jgi:AraC-like DNA-binding protein
MDFSALKPYVREVTKKVIKANQELPIRHLIAYQIIIVTEGEAQMNINGVVHNVAAGDVLFIPPNIPYDYKTKINFEQLHIYFDPVYSELSRVRNISYSSFAALPSGRQIFLQENIYEKYNLPYLFKPENLEDYLKCWWEIKDSVKKNNSFVSEIKMLKMLNLIHSQYGIKTIKENIDYCEAIKDYVDANFEQIINLDDISKLFEISKFTISKKFKSKYDVSIIAYYNSKRLEYAKKELTDNQKSISSIAKVLNFTDVYTFSKFFKMHTGVSPKKYRESSMLV